MMAFVATNSGHLITSATTLIVGAITTYISHTTTASISSDRQFEAINQKIEVLDAWIASVEKDVKMLNDR